MIILVATIALAASLTASPGRWVKPTPGFVCDLSGPSISYLSGRSNTVLATVTEKVAVLKNSSFQPKIAILSSGDVQIFNASHQVSSFKLKDHVESQDINLVCWMDANLLLLQRENTDQSEKTYSILNTVSHAETELPYLGNSRDVFWAKANGSSIVFAGTSDDNLWIATYDSGVYRQFASNISVNVGTHSYFKKRNNSIYIGTCGSDDVKGIKFNLNSHLFTAYKGNFEYASPVVGSNDVVAVRTVRIHKNKFEGSNQDCNSYLYSANLFSNRRPKLMFRRFGLWIPVLRNRNLVYCLYFLYAVGSGDFVVLDLNTGKARLLKSNVYNARTSFLGFELELINFSSLPSLRKWCNNDMGQGSPLRRGARRAGRWFQHHWSPTSLYVGALRLKHPIEMTPATWLNNNWAHAKLGSIKTFVKELNLRTNNLLQS